MGQASFMNTLKTEAPAYTDLAGLSKLKRAAGNDDPAAIRAVAQQFESLFTRMMLKSMRDATGTDPMFGSDQQQLYQGMADDQWAIQLSRGKGLGLADLLIRQLQKMGVKGADAAKGSGGGGIAGARAAAAYSATERISASVPDAAKATFVQDLWPQAQQAGLLLGVDPRHLIAQSALETNWGHNMPQDAAGRCSNNLFGMKVSADWTGPAATHDTREFQNGVAATTSAQFKVYATPAQSFQDYVAVLRDNPRYATALNTGSDVQRFATALQRSGYATDPDYASKIVAMTSAVAHKLGGISRPDVTDLKLAGSLPISPNTGAL